MLDRILIVADDSDPAKCASGVGFELARTYDAAVEVLYVLEPGTRSDDAATEQATAMLDEATAHDAPGSVETHIEEGRPAEVITTVADDHGVDLIVMGRQGRSGLDDRLLGSVTERVLREMTVPVLATPGDESEVVEGFHDVLVTTDGSEVSERAAPYASDIASRFGARLHLLTVVDVAAEGGVFNAGGVSKEFVERLESKGHEALDRFIQAIGDVEVEICPSVVRGSPREAIEEYVSENDIDLLVMASEGQNNVVGQRLGSVTARVLRTVDVPVLVVPTPS